MKPSAFNVFVRDEPSTIVYNALSGSITKVNNDLAEAIKNDRWRYVSLDGILDTLKQQGVLASSPEDERQRYADLHEHWKAGKEQVEFNALLTYDCNFECPYCYQGRGEKGQQMHGFRDMPADVAQNMTTFMKTTATERQARKMELVLYGGEPFLPQARKLGHKMTDEISTWARKNGLQFGLHVLSNGSLMTKKDVDWLGEYKARLQIPVDGDKPMHDSYRYCKTTRKGSYEGIMKVLGMTKDTGIETHIRISLTDDTYPSMEKLLTDLQSRGLTHVYPDFCYITAFTEACEGFKEHTLGDAKLFTVMPQLWRSAHKKGFPLDIRPRVQPLPCSSVADGSFIIDPFGDAYKCWELVGLKEHKVGSLLPNGTLERTPIYRDVLARNPLNIPACAQHSYLPACGGGCVCKAFWQRKTYHAPGCGTEKYLLPEKIRTYVETLNTKDIPMRATDKYELQVIEGPQKPRMSHCYVLV